MKDHNKATEGANRHIEAVMEAEGHIEAVMEVVGYIEVAIEEVEEAGANGHIETAEGAEGAGGHIEDNDILDIENKNAEYVEEYYHLR